MPRRNRTTPHTPYKQSLLPNKKRRFATRQQAQAAAEYQMLLKPQLELYVYKDIDGGWYLTRTKRQ